MEARYFYSVDIVPMVDVTQRSANVPRAYSKLEREAAKADWEDHDKRYNFPDCYRVTVKVRGPLSNADQAAEENWGNYSKGAVEATLATIISNKEFGIGYLAYDVVSRFKSRSITTSSGEYAEVMWHSQINSSTGAVPDRATSAKAALDSRSIFVSGVGNGTDNKRFYPESFTMLDPSRLTLNEMFDTGPAIVDGSGSYYMLRHQSNPWDGCRYPSGREYNAGKVNWNADGTPGNPARCWVPQNTAGWDDVSWSSANDYVWSSTNTRYNNHTNMAGKYKNADAVIVNDYIPGGLNLLGQDNILIVCVKGSKVYAESNKLLFMVPPHTTDVVGVYGKDYITDNNTDYWRFDLLNQVYGRDSDCSNRPVVYGSANLADGTYDGDYSLGTSPDTFNGTLNLSGIASAVYGYPKATFSSSGAFQDGTVVRFMMTMPKQ